MLAGHERQDARLSRTGFSGRQRDDFVSTLGLANPSGFHDHFDVVTGFPRKRLAGRKDFIDDRIIR